MVSPCRSPLGGWRLQSNIAKGTRITATRLTDGSVAGVAGGNATMQKIRAENPTSHRLKRW
jgi:hypothetical protein